MVKTTGAEFWRFYNDKACWPEGFWHDDEYIVVNGKEVSDLTEEDIPADSKVEISGGVVFMGESEEDGPSFESHFKKWRKAQSTTTITVECPKDKLDAIKMAIKAAGGRSP